ncbi:MAG: hypothetical protein HQL24_07015 [Candidatus Omnitrophica bacterium]|nr:hypothetical protein [Candidatus Omnitrophota bacterium]
MNNEIAITGFGCVIGGEESLERWLREPSDHSPSRRIDPAVYKSELSFIPQGPFELPRIEKIVAATLQKTLKSAKISITDENSSRCAILMGNTYGSEEFKTSSLRGIERKEPAKIFLVPYSATNALAAKMSIMFNFKGPDITFSSGAVSASEAILVGSDLINDGRADIVFVGGINVICDDLEEAFDQCGFRQESCAFVVLEKKKSARTAGKKIHATLGDGRHGFCADKDMQVPQKIIKSFLGRGNQTKSRSVILNRGNSFGEKFSDNEKFIKGLAGKKNFISLDDLLGNTFCASGALGAILGSLLLDGKKAIKEVLFVNQDSFGSYVSMVIRR